MQQFTVAILIHFDNLAALVTHFNFVTGPHCAIVARPHFDIVAGQHFDIVARPHIDMTVIHHFDIVAQPHVNMAAGCHFDTVAKPQIAGVELFLFNTVGAPHSTVARINSSEVRVRTLFMWNGLIIEICLHLVQFLLFVFCYIIVLKRLCVDFN